MATQFALQHTPDGTPIVHPERKWALSLNEQAFGMEYVRRFPKADCRPNKDEFLAFWPRKYGGLDPETEKEMLFGGATKPEMVGLPKETTVEPVKAHESELDKELAKPVCKCGFKAKSKFGLQAHVRRCKKLLAMKV